MTTYANGRVESDEHALKPAGCDPQTDTQRCRLGTDALAMAALEPTAATVRTTYEHGDAAWPDKVTAISRPSVRVAGQLQRENYVYDPSTGVLLSKTVCGWESIDNSAVETCRVSATAMYGSGAAPQFNPGGMFLSAWMVLPQPNLPSQVDGPRTDVPDVTSFVYYPESNWKLRDRFTNPLAQGEPGGNPGKPNDLMGVPFDIVADWSVNSIGGGSW